MPSPALHPDARQILRQLTSKQAIDFCRRLLDRTINRVLTFSEFHDKDGEIYYPWKLDANAKNQAATKGDNFVDNLEKVDVGTEIGTYTITITHKATLKAVQKVSLIVSGGGFLTLGNEKLETEDLDNTVLAYHNIIKDVITIRNLDSSNAINNTRIFDINGRMLANKKQASQQLVEIDASALNSGIYFLNIQTEKGTHSIKTLVK